MTGLWLGAGRFRALPPAWARLLLLAFAVVTVGLVGFALPLQEVAQDPAKQGDLQTYAQVVERLRLGVPYYEALHAELAEHRYGTHSVFNWRTPLFLSGLAMLPNEAAAQGLLIGLAVLAGGMASWLARRSGGPLAGLLTALLLGLSLFSVLVPRASFAFELWAGVLILLSVSAYGLQLPWLGLAAALLALFLRELAGAYVVICLVLAWRERRWSEVAAWGVGLAAYAVYFVLHWRAALAMVRPEDIADAESWLQFGGLGFVIGSASYNGIFLVLPYWATALALGFGLAGLAGGRQPAGWRALLTVLGYLGLFSIFGKPVNQYWGGLYTPLLMPGLVWALPALRDLWLAAGRR